MLEKIKKHFNFESSIYIIFSVYVVTMLLPETSLSILEPVVEYTIKCIRYVCYFFFIAKIVLDWKKEKNEVTLTMIFIAILSIVIYFFSGKKNIVILILALLALRNTDKDRLIKIALKTYIIVFSCILIGSLFNLIPDWTYSRGNILRHSLGFSYPTITMGYYLMIIMMYAYIRKNEIKIYEISTLEIINIFLYKYTDGRISFILGTAILIFALLKKTKVFKVILKQDFIQKVLKTFCYVTPILLVFFILLMTYFYSIGSNFAYFLDSVLNNRIEFSYKAFQDYEITVFGQETQWNGWGGVGYSEDIDTNVYEYNYLDNSYSRLILDYGIVLTIIVIGGYTHILVKNYYKKDYWTIFIVFTVLILAEIEPCIIDLNKNIFVILFIPLFDYGPIDCLKYKNIKRLFVKTRG